jgi:hypothetical protein
MQRRSDFYQRIMRAATTLSPRARTFSLRDLALCSGIGVQIAQRRAGRLA